MSETSYMRISTQNIACSQRQIRHAIHHSVTYYEHTVCEREGGGGGRERERELELENFILQ